MTADDEKDPPVPADVEGRIPKRVYRDGVADSGRGDDEALADKPRG